METLSLNTHHDMPQQIFEVGQVTLLDKKSQTGASEYERLAVAVTGVQAGFAQVRSMAQALAGQFGKELKAEAIESDLFMPGRGAKLLLEKEVISEKKRIILHHHRIHFILLVSLL